MSVHGTPTVLRVGNVSYSHFGDLGNRYTEVQSAEMDQEILEAFASYQRASALAETTIRNRASFLRSLQQHAGPLLDISVHDIRDYLGRPGVEISTRATERGAFMAFFRFAHEEEYREDNPTKRLAPISVPKGTPRPFTREQIDAMLTSGAYRKTRAMILVGYYQGFRVSSIARVHSRDIDPLTNTIRTIGKGSKAARLPLSEVVLELAKYMPADGYWFPARKDPTRPMSSASVTNLITLAKKRAGITDEKLTPHSLRHSFGTDLVDAGVDIRVIQELMMHENLSTTQIYTRVSEERKQRDIKTLQPRPILLHSGRHYDARQHPQIAA